MDAKIGAQKNVAWAGLPCSESELFPDPLWAGKPLEGGLWGRVGAPIPTAAQ